MGPLVVVEQTGRPPTELGRGGTISDCATHDCAPGVEGNLRSGFCNLHSEIACPWRSLPFRRRHRRRRLPSRSHEVSLDLLQVEIADHPVVALTDVRPQRAIPMASALSEVMLPDEHTIASIGAGIE